MSGRIYLIQDDDSLQALEERPYRDEDLLQTLLEKYPELLAGEQINEASPRRWLLIDREMGVPIEEGGGDHMSLDHLFLDQDGIPTLVEVKRSTDTRIRREVVGQMLDYAANAVAYWPVESIRARFEAAVDDHDRQLASFLELEEPDEQTIEGFWGNVKTNLQARKIRLVFVADVIPATLRRIVEFLNEQMDPAEVLAVELPQFVGQGIRTIVPRVIGQTADAEQKKGRPKRERRQWDDESFFAEMKANLSQNEVDVARSLLEWARTNVGDVEPTDAMIDPSYPIVFEHDGRKHRLFYIRASGSVELQLRPNAEVPPFNAEDMQLALLKRLNAIPGVDIAQDAVNRYPKLPFSLFVDEANLRQFLKTYEWFLEQAKTA